MPPELPHDKYRNNSKAVSLIFFQFYLLFTTETTDVMRNIHNFNEHMACEL